MIEQRIYLPDGIKLPCDHGYGVFSAISRHYPQLHGKDIRIGPICGKQIGNRTMVTKDSFIPVRGASLSLDVLNLFGVDVRVSVNEVTFELSRVFVARIVCIKNAFTESAMSKHLPAWCMPIKRRTLNVKGREIIGFQVRAEPPSIECASQIVASGIGGRGRFGAGFFIGVNL